MKLILENLRPANKIKMFLLAMQIKTFPLLHRSTSKILWELILHLIIT